MPYKPGYTRSFIGTGISITHRNLINLMAEATREMGLLKSKIWPLEKYRIQSKLASINEFTLTLEHYKAMALSVGYKDLVREADLTSVIVSEGKSALYRVLEKY